MFDTFIQFYSEPLQYSLSVLLLMFEYLDIYDAPILRVPFKLPFPA